jgi:hypothetical protein
MALLCVSMTALAAGGGSFGALGSRPPPGDALEPTNGFDSLRKPPIPVSFLAHDGGWIQFLYPPSARERTAPLIARADDLRAELAEALGQTPLDAVEIRVARGPEEMSTLAPQASPPGAQDTAASYPKLRLVVLSLGSMGSSDAAELQAGFRRELARLALAEAVSGRPIPPWFVEGFVRHFSKEGDWGREWTLYRAALRQRTRPISELDAMLQGGGPEMALASAEATGLVDFLLKPSKRSDFSAAVERLAHGDGLESALFSGYGSSLSVMERHWRSELSRRTTLATVFSSMGVPAVLFVGWGALRMLRRQRSRAARAKVAGQAGAGVSTSTDAQPVHIVLSRRDDRFEPPVLAEAEIPRIEHEGEWHTLH